MSVALSAALLLTALAGLAFWNVFRKLVSRERIANFTVENLIECTTVNYRQMAHLLDESEFQYLSSQPGYTAKLGRRFRSDRRRIFRRYLKSMRRDFGRLYVAAKLLALLSAEDRPELAATLIRQRLLFAFALLMVEYRLALHAINRRPVDVKGLVEGLESIQSQVRQYALVAQAR